MRHPREALAELSAGELDTGATAVVRAHVAACNECRTLLAGLDRSLGALALPEPWREPPPMRRAAVHSPMGAALAVGLALIALVAVGVLVPRIADHAAATAPPQRTDGPQPTPGTTARASAWPAGSSEEVARNLPRDPNFAPTLAALSSGVDADPRAVGKIVRPATPIEVRALRHSDQREFLVPLVADDQVIAVMAISVDAQGNGRLVATRGWSSSPSFPRYSAAEAQARAVGPGESPVRTELVWAPIRGRADELQPFWRVVLSSGRVVYIFEDGGTALASDLGLE